MQYKIQIPMLVVLVLIRNTTLKLLVSQRLCPNSTVRVLYFYQYPIEIQFTELLWTQLKNRPLKKKILQTFFFVPIFHKTRIFKDQYIMMRADLSYKLQNLLSFSRFYNACELQRLTRSIHLVMPLLYVMIWKNQMLLTLPQNRTS